MLNNVRLGFHKENKFTRVVLDLEGEKDAKIYKKNHGLYEVFLPGAKASTTKKTWKYKKSYISKISLTNTGDSLKILINTRIKYSWVKSFYLDGQIKNNKGYRLVIDFYSDRFQFEKSIVPDSAKELKVVENAQPMQKANVKEKVLDQTSGPVDMKEVAHVERAKGATKTVSKSKMRRTPGFNPLSGEIKSAFNLPLFPGGEFRGPGKHRTPGRESGSLPQIHKIPRKTGVQGNTPRQLASTEEQENGTNRFNVKEPVNEEAGREMEHSLKTDEEKISQAEKEISHKRYVSALSVLGTVKPGILPDQWQKRYHLAMQEAAFFTEDYQIALKHLEILLKRWSKLYLEYPEILKHTGECLYNLKKYDEAPKYLLWYYNLFPSSKDNDILLGKVAECILKTGYEKLAVEMFKFVIEEYKNADGALISRIRIAEIIERNKNIAEEFEKSPEELYESVINLSPRSPISDIARAKLASWYYRKKKYQEGAEVFNSLARRAIESSMLLEVKTKMEQLLTDWVAELFRQKKYDEIIHVYEIYYPYFDPAIHSSYLYYLAESYRVSGKFADAIHFYRKALIYCSNDLKERSLLGLGTCFLKIAQPRKALSVLLKIKGGKIHNLALFYAGKAYVLIGDYSSAVNVFKGLLNTSFNNRQISADVRWWLGFSYYQQGKLSEAERCFDEVLEQARSGKVKLDPNRLASVLYYYSNCKMAVDEFNGVYDDLEKALRIARKKKLKEAISETLALLMMKTTSLPDKANHVIGGETRGTVIGISKEISDVVVNKGRIRKLQEQLKEKST